LQFFSNFRGGLKKVASVEEKMLEGKGPVVIPGPVVSVSNSFLHKERCVSVDIFLPGSDRRVERLIKLVKWASLLTKTIGP
jgi:hypothetical protein